MLIDQAGCQQTAPRREAAGHPDPVRRGFPERRDLSHAGEHLRVLPGRGLTCCREHVRGNPGDEPGEGILGLRPVRRPHVMEHRAPGDVHVVVTACQDAAATGPEVPGIFAADPRVYEVVPEWSRARPRFDVCAHRAFCPGPRELQAVCNAAAIAERCATVTDSTGQLYAEIRPARVDWRESAGA